MSEISRLAKQKHQLEQTLDASQESLGNLPRGNMTRAEKLLTGLAIATAVVVPSAVDRVQHEKVQETAIEHENKARIAVAERIESCDVISKEATPVPPDVMWAERREGFRFTIKPNETPEALEAMEEYKDDDGVQWWRLTASSVIVPPDHQIENALSTRLTVEGQVIKRQPDGSMVVDSYPLQSHRPGSTLVVYTTSRVTSVDDKNWYTDTGRTACDTVYQKQDDGSWQPHSAVGSFEIPNLTQHEVDPLG